MPPKNCNVCGRFIGKEHICPEVSPSYGKHHTEEAKRKMSESTKEWWKRLQKETPEVLGYE